MAVGIVARTRHLFARPPLRDRSAAHFLHIGKNAGTQIKAVIAAVQATPGAPRIVAHPHRVRLSDIPSDVPYFFSIRDPIARFRSGFYSRLRKGQPRILKEWTESERRAFETFAHANDLAEALSDDGPRRHLATAAMKSIIHVSMNQVDWFSRMGFVLHHRPPVWIIRQDRFDADLAELLHRLGTGPVAQAPEARHANDYAGAPPLSDLARQNLAAWYTQDIAFCAMCEDWLRAQTPTEVAA